MIPGVKVAIKQKLVNIGEKHLMCQYWHVIMWYFAVLKCGMYCSLYEVMGKSKQENSLSGLLQRLERERMVSSFKGHFTLW